MNLTRDQILEAVHKTAGLPSFPEVVLKLEKELAKGQPSVSKASNIVSSDPALSARFLQVANSAFYTRGKKTVSINQAVARLGLIETKRLAVATAMVGRYRGLGGGDANQFWTHCLAVGFSTQTVESMAIDDPDAEKVESAFSAGLIHDIGILALFHLFPEEYKQLNQVVQEHGGTTYEMELQKWQIDHGEVGEILARQWELPEPICQVVRHHHSPWNAEPQFRRLAQIVHISDFICHNQGFSRLESGFPDSFDHSAWESLGLSLDQVPEIIDQVRKQGEQSEAFMAAFS